MNEKILHEGPSDPELLLLALVAPLPAEKREEVAEKLRAAREFRQSDAGRIPNRDLRHVDLFGRMGGGAWPSYAREHLGVPA